MTRADEKVQQAEQEVKQARAALAELRTAHSQEALCKLASRKKMSAYGIWVLCLPPIAGMYLAGNLGLGLPALVAGLVAPGVGFWLISRSAEQEGAEKYAALAPQERALEHRLAEALANHQAAVMVPSETSAAVQEDSRKILVNGVTLAKKRSSKVPSG
ncbi:hypothetical protein DYH09_02075 [bacterium CPR1]|nr:hypothetical protein [bacterium CPR1]